MENLKLDRKRGYANARRTSGAWNKEWVWRGLARLGAPQVVWHRP
ncbi:hypothetical protein [Candidatus Hakubella thermalkaliphila]|nr:hypothetical protein [Candidatus Hakubella thermalkaliphila]